MGGFSVAPAFIDMRSHSDHTLPSAPEAESRIGQGITNEVFGNCGYSPAPVDPARREAVIEWSASLARGLDFHGSGFGEYLGFLPISESRPTSPGFWATARSGRQPWASSSVRPGPTRWSACVSSRRSP